jgi:hypothetical protein
MSLRMTFSNLGATTTPLVSIYNYREVQNFYKITFPGGYGGRTNGMKTKIPLMVYPLIRYFVICFFWNSGSQTLV